MNTVEYMTDVGENAREASRVIASAETRVKNDALLAMAREIRARCSEILRANQKDLENARQKELSAALIDRLALTEKSIDAMAEGLEEVAKLPDPVGEIDGLKARPSGIKVGKMRVPIGVIGIIYESRPNVTADAAALCIKSGNAAILRGGSEAILSNQIIGACVATGLTNAGLPQNVVQVIETTDRDAVGQLITMEQFVDVVVPRGGKGLIERISRDARVPVIKHLDGVCHVYIDRDADTKKAIAIAINAKTQRYGTCNTMETLLVHEAVASNVLPEIGRLLDEQQVEMRGDMATIKILKNAKQAAESDWGEEYLGPILAIKIVDGLDEAIHHISTYGSNHTDSIVTENHSNAMRFLREVDSSSVMLNASTRFADGFEYGLGAEIGISTNKLHARGPVGLEGLTTTKWVVLGSGEVRI